MKKAEILGLLRYLNSFYGKKFEIPTAAATLDMKVNTWYKFLKDYDYKISELATDRLITNKEWPPTPGEIAREVKKLQTPEQDKLTAGEAWELVVRAIRKYGVLYGTKEAEASLPRKVLKAVNCIGGLRNVGMSDENDTYYMNMFLKVYNDVSEAIDLDERLPEGIRKESQMLAERFRRPRLEGTS